MGQQASDIDKGGDWYWLRTDPRPPTVAQPAEPGFDGAHFSRRSSRASTARSLSPLQLRSPSPPSPSTPRSPHSSSPSTRAGSRSLSPALASPRAHFSPMGSPPLSPRGSPPLSARGSSSAMGSDEVSPTGLEQLLVGTTSARFEMASLASHSPRSPRSPTRMGTSSHPRTVAMLRRGAESKHAPDALVPNWALGPWPELPCRATGARDGRRWTGAPLAK